MSEYYPYNYKGYPAGLKYPWTFPMPSEKERDRRWTEIRNSMRKHNIDCLIVTAPYGYMPFTNYIYYLSNYVPFSNMGTYIVFPLEGNPQLGFSNSIGPQFVHCAAEKSWITEIAGSLDAEGDVVKKVKQLKLEKGRLGIVGYKTGVFPAVAYNVLRESFPSAAFTDATPAVNEAMNKVSRTSEEEFTFLKKACEILDHSYDAVAKSFKPGVKEYELWAAAEQAIINNGGWYSHFMLVSSGPKPTFPRAPASNHALKMGDRAIFEINALYGGVSVQICYTLSLGKPGRKTAGMYEFVKELYEYSLAELEKARTFGEIERDLVDRIHNNGYEPMTPQIHIYNQAVDMPVNSPPQPGDYFTVHPNICTKDYSDGAKFGDTVHITKDGKVERLQKTPARLNIILP